MATYMRYKYVTETISSLRNFSSFSCSSLLKGMIFEKSPVTFIIPTINHPSLRWRGKHWNPKFKKERAAKVIKIELPDFEELRQHDKLTPDEMRSKMKAKGIAPARRWTERPMLLAATSTIFEPYVPPEGDGKISLLTTDGAKQKLQVFQKKSKSFMALRKLRSFEDAFDLPDFAQKAQEMYIEAMEAVVKHDTDRVHELVTEKCYPEMMHQVRFKTIRWKFVQSLEPPRGVQARITSFITEDNYFAQITVRLHTQQILAVYDRFGRLMHGSEDAVKDVLEYVVFEKHISSAYGTWRIHGKIVPDWMPAREPIKKTYVKPETDLDENDAEKPKEKTETSAEIREHAASA